MAMKRKRTKLDPQGQEMDGMPVKDIQIDEWVQRRHASAAHLNVAAKRSLERTMLEAGYLGVCQLSCDEVIDVDERDRWDRNVKNYKATIEELTRKVAELTAQVAALLAAKDQGTGDGSSRVHGAERNARVSDESSVANQPLGNADPACISQSLMHPTRALDESRTAENTPAVNHDSPESQVVSPVQNASSDERPDSPPAAAQRHESDESRPSPIRQPPTYVTVLGPGGRHLWLKKPEN
jgi:hypothetical protein